MGTAKRLGLLAAAGIAMSLASMPANAAVLDIVKYIDGPNGDGTDGAAGESAVTADIIFDAVGFSDGNLALSAFGSNAGGTLPDSTTTYPTGTTGPFAYLDKDFGRTFGTGTDGTFNAGMGVCQTINGSDQCTPSSDDNVTGTSPTEILSLRFDEAVNVDGLFVNDDGHTSNFGTGAEVAYAVNGGAFSVLDITPGVNNDLGTSLVDDGLLTLSVIQLALGDVLHLKYVNHQFYLSAISVSPSSQATPVPLPAGLLLLLSGMLGLGFLGRFRAKTT